MAKKQKAKRMWGGRFDGELDPRIDRYNQSLPYDQRLVEEDIDGSVAWARGLRRIGVLDAKELGTITKALERVRREFAQDRFEAEPGDEDIHTAVERRVVEIAGNAGAKLHTGRSRNDQVATDLHLWLKKACDEIEGAIASLQRTLVEAATAVGETAIPAYTHLQRAQPVLLAHHLLAYCEMVQRDRERFADTRKRADVMPLGCGAAVGSGFAIDRAFLAKELGFRKVSANSLDAVGSRDAALEFLSAASILAMHLSRLGEEIVLWASKEFGFLRLGDTVSTGSSLLPQKRNPDGAELARGKAGRVLGRFLGLATTLKGLPLAYNKDLQEDKEAVFEAFDTITGTLGALEATLAGSRFDADRCAEALEGGHLLSTELADYLVRKGMPFRRAHEVVGKLVQTAEQKGVDIKELDLATLQDAAPEIGPDVKRALTVSAALRAKRAVGGTAPARVKRALAAWRKRLAR
ncbi:MAG: argininosuccinate lyase [Planctomycetota bacterium]